MLLGTSYLSSFLIIPKIPIPQLSAFFVKLLGAKIGKNVGISFGVIISEPYLLEVGNDSFIGGFCGIYSHVYDNKKYVFKKIKIGNNVLIGGSTEILPGVVIEDYVTIGLKSMIPKNKVIPKNTVWGGVPIKRIK